MADTPRAPTPRLRHATLLSLGLALVLASGTYLVFAEWLPGWLAGLFLGAVGGRALARRRPDLADPTPAPAPQPWQKVVVVVLVVAVLVALVVTFAG